MRRCTRDLHGDGISVPPPSVPTPFISCITIRSHSLYDPSPPVPRTNFLPSPHIPVDAVLGPSLTLLTTRTAVEQRQTSLFLSQDHSNASAINYIFSNHIKYFVEQFLPRDAMLARYMHRPCVRLYVCRCLSQVGVLIKRLNIGLQSSHKQNHVIAQGL